MAYKIAVGSSDEVKVDLKFREVEEFLIYEIEGREAGLVEKRKVSSSDSNSTGSGDDKAGSDENKAGSGDDLGCGGNGKGCGENAQGCGGNGQGCSGPKDVTEKIEVIKDCRAVLCKKVGFQAQKQFEKKAISVFDIECDIKDALDKISFYYDRIDKKQSLRK